MMMSLSMRVRYFPSTIEPLAEMFRFQKMHSEHKISCRMVSVAFYRIGLFRLPQRYCQGKLILAALIETSITFLLKKLLTIYRLLLHLL